MNRSALVFGLAFLILGGAYLLEELGAFSVRPAVLLALLVIMAGLMLVGSSMAGVRR